MRRLWGSVSPGLTPTDPVATWTVAGRGGSRSVGTRLSENKIPSASPNYGIPRPRRGHQVALSSQERSPISCQLGLLPAF